MTNMDILNDYRKQLIQVERALSVVARPYRAKFHIMRNNIKASIEDLEGSINAGADGMFHVLTKNDGSSDLYLFPESDLFYDVDASTGLVRYKGQISGEREVGAMLCKCFGYKQHKNGKYYKVSAK